jgi:Na+-translocating ferredoxin:NAD+ oxidoreductase RnfD subunit
MMNLVPETSRPRFLHRVRRVIQRGPPPARLLWVFLAALALYGVQWFGYGTGLASLLVLPIVAVVLDFVFQAARFPSLRFPDAAIATGLFLTLIFPPTAPLLLAATATGGAIALRHILRYRGRPWFNPTMTGALLGSLLFGLAPAWWIAVGPTVAYGTLGELAMLAMGGALLLRNLRAWRLPAAFFAAYVMLAVIQHLLVGASTDPRILFLEAIDPVTIFFGLFMVTEPRSAPATLPGQTLYAGVVGVAAAVFPIFTPTLAVFLALLVGNLMAVALRRAPERSVALGAEGAPAVLRRANRSADRRRGKTQRRAPVRWPTAHRISAGVVVLGAIAAVVGISGLGHSSTPLFQLTGPGSGGGGTGNCAKDNPSIPASTLSTLHKMLGPSVILSYDSGTGVVVFYDPINQVTVTETDLYEDYGYADFNGDDYAASGCA